jgi:hypothetical protein
MNQLDYLATAQQHHPQPQGRDNLHRVPAGQIPHAKPKTQHLEKSCWVRKLLAWLLLLVSQGVQEELPDQAAEALKTASPPGLLETGLLETGLLETGLAWCRA